MVRRRYLRSKAVVLARSSLYNLTRLFALFSAIEHQVNVAYVEGLREFEKSHDRWITASAL